MFKAEQPNTSGEMLWKSSFSLKHKYTIMVLARRRLFFFFLLFSRQNRKSSHVQVLLFLQCRHCAWVGETQCGSGAHLPVPEGTESNASAISGAAHGEHLGSSQPLLSRGFSRCEHSELHKLWSRHYFFCLLGFMPRVTLTTIESISF